MSISDKRFRERYGWPLLLLVAVLSYLYLVDGLYIPRIGDESPYIDIVRLTAESGRWLPLDTPSGLENTKPPLLFWLGIASTNWARHWSLFRLRLPIILMTLVTAGLVFLLARRLAGDREGGYLAALSFLGFRSTFQYGRPFLTNMPESLFVFLPWLVLIVHRRRLENRRLSFALLLGVPLGIACLFKSFALVVPFGLALAWLLLSERGWNVADWMRNEAPRIAAALLVALLCFALWPLLDPEPWAVIRQFVLEENLGKLSPGGYFSGLFTGTYPVYRIWLAPFASAGFFALPLVAVAGAAWSRRRTLGFEEKSLWIFALSFLIVYTFPSQRQENYLLPIMPAVAVLLGTQWMRIPRRWFHLLLLPAPAALLVLLGLMLEIEDRALGGNGYALWQYAVPTFALLLWTVSFLFAKRLAPVTFHLLGFLLFFSLTCMLAPFDGPAGRFAPERAALLRFKTVYVPESFVSKQERHRFLLPGARIEGYDPHDLDLLSRLLRSRQYVVIHRPLGEAVEGPFRIYGRRLDLRTRQSREEMMRILFGKEIELFIQQEIIVRRHSIGRERGDGEWRSSKPF